MSTVAIVTGATGSGLLRDNVLSVRAQTVPVQHWIVVDGADREHAVRKLLGKLPANAAPTYSQHIVVLPQNTGGSGYLCHRINGALPWLVSTAYVAYLDEDNAIEPTHVADLLSSMPVGARWAHSLRTIMDSSGKIQCPDSCESLGGISHTVLDITDHHIDTNCYLLERELAVQISPLWNVKARQPGVVEADRQVCRMLLEREPVHGVSRQHSVRYRVDGRADSVGAQFFSTGNATLGKGVGGYAFDARQDLYLFHFSPEASCAYVHGDPDRSPLGEWCPTAWLRLGYNLIEGFANMATIPRGATCLVSMCHPATLPMDFFASRPDLHRIVYTAEGPNIRHQAQWDRAFLSAHFDVVLTYWQPLLDDPAISTVFAPHNSRFLAFPEHESVLRRNRGASTKTVGLVLERRQLAGTYEINGTRIRCLDPLRERYVTGLRDVTVHGAGWGDYCATHPGVALGKTGPREDDPASSIDHLCKFEFALIVENCDAEGYISEKVADAFIAGCIPLYYGTPSALVDIPASMHIDIRQFADGRELQEYLDVLSLAEISLMRREIYAHRTEFLERRGCEAMARAVQEAIKNKT